MDEQWWQLKLQALQNNHPQRLEVLTAMVTNFNSDMPRPIIDMLLNSQALLECAEAEQETEQPIVNLALDLIRDSLHKMPLNMSDPHWSVNWKNILTSNNYEVRSIMLNKMQTELKSEGRSSVTVLLPNNHLVCYVLNELMQAGKRNGISAIAILSMLLEQQLDDAEVQNKLLMLLKHKDSSVRCLAYELGVSIAKHSASALQSIDFVLDAAISELDNDDVLLQSTILEILTPLAEQNHGVTFIYQRRVFEVIMNRVKSLAEDGLDMLLVPAIMKFYGKIAVVQPQRIICDYSELVVSLFEVIESDDINLLPTAIDTLTNLASTTQGILLLQANFGSHMKQTMLKYAEYIKSLPDFLKVRLLNSLEVIFTLEKQRTVEINLLLQSWYEFFAGGKQINAILEILNMPFDDLQAAAFSLLKVLCSYDWGITALQSTAGAIEFLLARQTGLLPAVNFLKWELMELLTLKEEFSASEIVRFTAYVNEGPFYKQKSMHVATEEQGNP